MTEEEMIRLAAKACGKEFVGWDSYFEQWECYDEETDCNFPWNPKERDGDAFRLMVALGMKIRVRIVKVSPAHGNPGVEIILNGNKRIFVGCSHEEHEYAKAAREAIFLAAIEIGKGIV